VLLHRVPLEEGKMAEVFVQFAAPIVAKDGTIYLAQACGAPDTDGMWEGWIEFLPVGGGPAVRSPRETTQPNRAAAAYWATGLTPVYLEGALQRARHPLVVRTLEPAQPLFDEPAPYRVEAILDPFSAYEKGEVLMRQELGALSPLHLVNIIRAYRLSDEATTMLNRLPAATLIEMIVIGVRVREHTSIRSEHSRTRS
jgi:hypothetical protein